MKAVRRRTLISKMIIVLLFIALILYVISLIVPVAWSVLTSLKTRGNFVEDVFGLPREWMFSNYKAVFGEFYVKVGNKIVDIPVMVVNSLLYSVGGAFCMTIVPCVTAYAVAKYGHYAVSKILYTVVIVCMILPIVGSLPSELNLVRSLNLYDTFFGIWLMKAHFLGMYFLVFHAAFLSLPKEFSEAAYVDGASNLRVLIQISLPLVRNTFFTVMLLHFISLWNDYQTPMLYIPSYPTLAYGMYQFEFNSNNMLSSVPMKLAGCMIVMLPVLIIFLIFHERLIGNISMGGVKE